MPPDCCISNAYSYQFPQLRFKHPALIPHPLYFDISAM